MDYSVYRTERERVSGTSNNGLLLSKSGLGRQLFFFLMCIKSINPSGERVRKTQTR